MLANFFDQITRLSLRYYWVTIALTVIVLVAGIVSLLGLNQELLPRIEFPQTIVIAQWPDADSAEQFLEAITLPLEERLMAVDGVVNVESTTNAGFAFVVVRNDFGLDQEAIVAGINAAVDATPLPSGANRPQVLNFSLNDLAVVVASISSAELSLPELKALVESELQPRLVELDQVSQVSISGGQELPEPVVVEAAPETGLAEEEADPGRLPLLVVQGARALGVEVEYVQAVTPEVLAGISGTEEQVLAVLRLIPPDTLPYAPPETLSYLPVEFTETLDPALQAQLHELAADYGGTGRYTLAEVTAILSGETAEPVAELSATPEPAETEATPAALPALEPAPLPESWIAGTAALGQTITDTSDITVEIMQGIVRLAPAQLNDLEPVMWRALDPAVTAVALPVVAEELEPALLAQLEAIQGAAKGQTPEPVALPESWVTAAAATGFPITTTAGVPPEALGFIATSAPALLDDLTEEMLLALSPAALAALPPAYLAELDEGLQQTLANIVIVDAQYQAAQTVAETETEPAPDPGRLPDVLIQGARAAGVEVEYAQDVPPDFMRQLSAFGPQGLQVLSLLTPDNLRLLQPEAIALLPAEFLETLDPELRVELDELAADYGGAGQLAIAEAEAADAAAADAPPLSGIWLEPNPEGEPSRFRTAADLMNSGFAPTAAAFLNFFPEASNVDDPAAWIGALSPEVIQYLVENEATFIQEVAPTTLELFAPETLAFLLDTYPDAFTVEQAQRLRAIAAGEVEAFLPEATITRTDGNPSVIVNLFKDGDANTVVVAHRIFDELAAFERDHPSVETNLVFEQATFIEESIAGVSREGALGAVFAVVVILLFLSGQVGGRYKLSWRATLVTAISIPMSIFTAFLLMRILPPTLGTWLNDLAQTNNNAALTFISRLFPTSVTLNIMTLSGLTVAIGRVVDDSIVVLENAYRYIQQGDDPKHAVIEGTREVAIAIFSATATTMAVFLPLGLVGGLIGSFFLPFALTVVYALAGSFIVSITVVPALTYLLIRREHIPEERETTMQRWYTPMLVWALNHRGYTLAVAAVIFVSSLFLLAQLPRSFIPEIGEPTINISVTLPAGTAMAETDELVERFETAVRPLAGIETIQSEIGSGGGLEAIFGNRGISQHRANIAISVANPDDLNPLTNQVRQQAETIFGAENVRVSAASQTSLGGFTLILTGESLEQLRQLAPRVGAAITSVNVDGDGIPDIANVRSSLDNGGETADTIIRIDGRPAISFQGELETANTLGVTNAAKQAVLDLGLPAGVQVTEGFDSEQQVQGFQSMITAIGYAIVIAYIVMGLTFRSFVHPFTILFSIPFALVGASLALFLTNSVLGISAMIGFMMLVGVVVTNGIVLLELVQQLRQKGRNAYEALVEGGRTRLRPIWMTALTAILALIPLAISQEAGAIIASELARAVMGGLLVSTALTLIVVPVVYSLFDELARRLRWRTRTRIQDG